MRPWTLLGMGSAAARHRLTGHRTPVHVMIALTDRCTAHCGYCDIPSRGLPGLDTDEILGLVDHLAARGTRRVGLWGGEPLLRDDIDRIVGRCADHGLFTTLDTNGALLPKRVEAVRRVSHLLLSLDGRRAHHDAQRGAGTYDRVLRAFAVARAARIPFSTISVLTRHTLGDVDHVLWLAERFGFRAMFQVLHHPPTLDGGRGSALAPAEADVRAALHRLIEAKRRGRPVGNSVAGLEALLAWPFGSASRSDRAPPGHPRCLAGRLYANVDADGRVYPCSLLIGEHPGRDLREVGFDEAFAAAGDHDCAACTATAFTEYNLLFGLDVPTLRDWVGAFAALGGIAPSPVRGHPVGRPMSRRRFGIRRFLGHSA